MLAYGEPSFLFVMADHAEDKICIFGFSRGAYTARALAGMLHKVCALLHHAGPI
jgi:uncharacterized protein (DUF2235 family)